jgi:hypothetical protein
MALLAGIFLVVLSAPRMLGYFNLAEVPPSVERALKAGALLSPPILHDARERYLDAIRFLPADAVVQQDMGRLELRRAAMIELHDSKEREKALQSASQYFRAAIIDAPGRAFPWSLEALVLSELSASVEDIFNHLDMSYFLAPHEASSMLVRARVGARLWAQLPTDLRRYISSDFAETWDLPAQRPILVDIYLHASFQARTAIRRAAFDDPKDEKIFDRMVAEAAGLSKAH